MKKLIVILALGGVGYLAWSWNQSKTELVEVDGDEVNSIETKPIPLTDIQAVNYLLDNLDVAAVFGAENIEGAKRHWIDQGFYEGRKIRG